MADRVSRTWTPKGMEVSTKDPITKDNLPDWFLAMKYKDLTYSFMMETFGEFEGVSKAHTYDLLEIPAGKYIFNDYNDKPKTNKNKFVTTLGIWVFNVILNHFNLSKLFNGYLNKNITGKVYGEIETKLSYALIEDDITTEQLKNYENTIQWLMPFEDVLSPNHTEKLLTCTKLIDKKKKEIYPKYKDKIEAGDVEAANEYQNELLDYAKEILGDDPSMDTMFPGSGTSWGNNFKILFVGKGMIKNPDPYAKQQYQFVDSSYMDGIKSDEFAICAGAGVQGAYSRGKKTEVGGAWEKMFIAAYQHITLDPMGSDCGTKRYITVDLTEKNSNLYIYSYIIKPNGELERLDSKNIDKYIGKTVKMRFSSLCESKTGICNKCAGDLLYMTAQNIGICMSQIPDKLKLTSMVSFHNSTIHTSTFNAMSAFFPFNK